MKQCRIAAAGRMLALLAPLALAACAGDPIPKAELGSASQAVQNAQQAGAPQFAAVELELARSKLDAANLAVRDNREAEARLLAEEARADANYAASKARAAVAQRAAVANRGWSAPSGIQSGSSADTMGQGGGAVPQQRFGTQGGLP